MSNTNIIDTASWTDLLAKINADPVLNYIVPGPIRGIVDAIGPKGKGVSIDQVREYINAGRSKKPFIDHEGDPFVLYIYDQAFTAHFPNNAYDKPREYKYHVMYCSTLQDMQRGGRSARYKAKKDLESTIFPVHRGSDNDERIEMRVCKNCLRGLNYKGYAGATEVRKDEIFGAFNMPEFFIDYAHPLLLRPTHPFSTGRYTKDWPEIARRIKAERGHRCEQCGITGNMDVHHINGVKDANYPSNLKVLCRSCHAKQPYHDHLRHLTSRQGTHEYALELS